LTPTLKTVDPAFGCRPDVSRTGNPKAGFIILPPAGVRVRIATRPVDFRHGNDKDDRAAYAGPL